MNAFIMIDLKAFGAEVRDWRTRQELTQQVVAELVGSTGPTISLLENHKRNGCRLDTYNKLAALIQIEPKLFWFDKERTCPGLLAWGEHNEDLIRGLCRARWGSMDVALVDEVEMEIPQGIWENAPFGLQYLTKLPSTYGYMPVEGPRQGAKLASVICF